MKSARWSGALPLVLAAFTIGFVMVAVILSCSTDRESADFNNPFDPSQSKDLPVPDSLRATVGDGSVHLTWKMPSGAIADEYAVFRKTPDEESEKEEKLLGKTESREYQDSRVRNGRRYVYRIAAGIDGRFGPRTEELDARPGLFSIVIAEDKPLTKTRSVTVAVNAQSAVSVRLAEQEEGLTGPWLAMGATVPWELSPGDGPKTLRAQFRFEDGSTSLPTSDSITLDTKAAIQSVSFEGPAIRHPGDEVHFRIVAEEVRGTAAVSIDGLLDKAPLFDDGTGGDGAADDGLYEADVVLSAKEPVARAQVRGTFTDEAGNEAVAVVAAQLITVRPILKPVSLLGADLAEPPSAASVTLHWTLFEESGFSAYRVYRGETAAVDSTDRLVTTVRDSGTLEAKDEQVVEGSSYHYRVYVQDTAGEQTGSNALEVAVPNLRPPEAVTIETGTASGPTRIAVQWNRSDALDFGAYRLYRNDSGAVDDGDILLLDTSDIARTMHVDTGLVENTAYHYRVYVDDMGGMSVPGNEVEIRTKNEPPNAVTLNEGAEVDTSAVTLSWGRSDAHDFASYKVYRDESPTVTTGSTEAVVIDERGGTSFRDRDLKKATRYYYRVFVFDDAPEAKSTGSNTITIRTNP